MTTKHLITFDCGLAYVGGALFDADTKKMLECFYIDTGVDARDEAEQTADLVLKIHEIFKPFLDNAQIVVEYPEQYSQTPAPRSSVQGLACTGGGIVCMLKRPTNSVHFVLPKVWKGQVPKDIMLERIVSKLSEDEKVLLESKKYAKYKKHNVIDAIGVGLYKLERLRGY
jgi:hypothetical protein